jgi:hypothetical protein
MGRHLNFHFVTTKKKKKLDELFLCMPMKYAAQPGHEEINCQYAEPRIFRTTSWKTHRWYIAMNQFWRLHEDGNQLVCPRKPL